MAVYFDAIDQLNVTITEVIDPVTYLAVIKRPESQIKHIKNLEDKLNTNFFQTRNEGWAPQNGELVIVIDKRRLECFRGVVHGVSFRTHSVAITVFLVDHAKFMTTEIEHIRKLPPEFAEFPYQSAILKLPCLQPLHLEVEIFDDVIARNSVASKWDESAYKYVDQVLKKHNFVARSDVLLIASRSQFSVRLYFFDDDDEICLNDKLVELNFASREKFPESRDLPTCEIMTGRTPGSLLADEQSVMKLPGGATKQNENSALTQWLNSISNTPCQQSSPEPLSQTVCSKQPLINEKSSNSTSVKSTSSHRSPAIQAFLSRLTVNVKPRMGMQSSDEHSTGHQPSLNRCNVPMQKEEQVHSPNEESKSIHQSPSSSGKESPQISPQQANLMSSTTFDPSVVGRSPQTTPPHISHSTLSVTLNATGQRSFNDKVKDISHEFQAPSHNRQLLDSPPHKSSSSASQSPTTSQTTSAKTEMQIPIVTGYSLAVENDCAIRDVFVYGNQRVKPWMSWGDANIDPALKMELSAKSYARPRSIQSYAWPAILRVRDVVLISSERWGKSLGYIVPLISSLLQPQMYNDLPRGSGPIVLILCSTYKSGMVLLRHCRVCLRGLNSKIKPYLLPCKSVLSDSEKSELFNGCDILIATPESFVKVFIEGDFCLTYLYRLSHFVVDDAHIITEKKEVTKISQAYCSVLRERTSANKAQQVILCSQIWSSSVEEFIKENMCNELTYIANMLEACVFTSLKMKSHVCSLDQRDNKLLGILRELPFSRIVISASTTESVFYLQSMLERQSYYVCSIHLDMSKADIVGVTRDWICSSVVKSHLIMVISDDIAVMLDDGIRNAGFLIHYDLPQNKLLFNDRFKVLFRQLSKQKEIKKSSNVESALDCCSHIIVTKEQNASKARTLVKLLQRFKDNPIDKGLCELAHQHTLTLQSPEIPLCPIWKQFGDCAAKPCNNRHIEGIFDDVTFSDGGELYLKIVHIESANRFFANLLKYESTTGECKEFRSAQTNITMKLQVNYASPLNSVTQETVNVGDLCAVRGDDGSYYRVCVLKIQDGYAKVQYLETGKLEDIKGSRLLVLMDELKATPAQAHELILCNVQPPDSNYVWHQTATIFVANLIRNQTLRAKIKKSLNQTVWIEYLTKYKYLDGIVQAYVKEFDVAKELLKFGHAIPNPDHLLKLNNAAKELDSLAQEILARKSPEPVASTPEPVESTPEPVESTPEPEESTSEPVKCQKVITKNVEHLPLELAVKETDEETQQYSELPVVPDLAMASPSTASAERKDSCRVTLKSSSTSKLQQQKLSPEGQSRPSMFESLLKRLKAKQKICVEMLDQSVMQEVYVPSVTTPGLFYVQRDDKCAEIDSLVEDINRDIQLLHKPDSICVGDFCLAPFDPFKDKTYNRARVEAVNRCGKVTVFSVDFGDTATVLRQDLRVLDKSYFDRLPFQAIPCSLSGIVPLDGITWTRESTDALWMLVVDEEVINVQLTLQVIEILPASSESLKEPKYEVLLYDKGRNELLSDDLLYQGLANPANSNSSASSCALPIPNNPNPDLLRNINQSDCETCSSQQETDVEQKSNETSFSSLMYWYQTGEKIQLKILMSGYDKYQLNVTSNNVNFRAAKENRHCSNNLDLYSNIDADNYEAHDSGGFVNIALPKVEKKKVWPRLVKDETRIHWLKYDVDHLDCSDDDSDSGECRRTKMFETAATGVLNATEKHKRCLPQPELFDLSDSEDDDFDDAN